ncbi:MAG TPA: hydroxyethylthiazole kinase [Bacteroidales bacterium]|nr:hydroxyethylthiazole kinase [Bacteroidales bacterium]
MITKESIIRDLQTVRSRSPLVHNITNYVVMNSSANALLAVGASPVMAHAVDEVEDMVKIASSLVINIGTLSKNWVESMIRAGRMARERSTPVVFDPVGAGATSYRTETSLHIIKECKPGVIRGNASEIMALVNEKGDTKGVDSIASSKSALHAAKILTKDTGAVIVISGPVDYIVDDQSVIEVRNGSPLMAKVTGLGCSATALVGAFIAINKNFLLASAHAMAVMGIAGELAAKKSEGPGTMQIHFLDELYKLSDKEISGYYRAGL